MHVRYQYVARSLCYQTTRLKNWHQTKRRFDTEGHSLRFLALTCIAFSHLT